MNKSRRAWLWALMCPVPLASMFGGQVLSRWLRREKKPRPRMWTLGKTDDGKQAWRELLPTDASLASPSGGVGDPQDGDWLVLENVQPKPMPLPKGWEIYKP